MEQSFARVFVAAFSLTAAFLPPSIQAQGSSWRAGAELRGGWFIPTSDMGVSGVTSARLQSAPAIALGFDVRPPSGLLGLRASATIGLSTGSRFSPTAQCVTACRLYSLDAGRFIGVAADLMASREFSRSSLQIGLGPALVRYDYGTQGFTGPCQSGTMCDDPFRKGGSRLALHAGGIVARRLEGINVLVTLEGFFSHRPSGGVQSDMTVGAGIGVGPVWARRHQ
jgi:hypothetical protein